MLSKLAGKRLIILLVVVLGVLVVAGLGRKGSVELVDDVSFSESDLDTLGEELDELSFDDLEGLSNGTGVGFSEFDLDVLGEALDQMSFEDLGGLTED